MKSLVEKIVTLIRETSSSLPEDVLKALQAAQRKEVKGSSAAVVLKTILDNCAIAKERGTPLCQDTGTLTFFVDERLRRKVTPAVLKKAVALATERGYLRKNTIDSMTGKSYDDNCAEGAPVVHYIGSDRVEIGSASVGLGSDGIAARSKDSKRLYADSKRPYVDSKRPYVTLILKGGGSENMSRQYSLPDAALGAGRDLAGVRACVFDAVQKIQGYGCAPGVLGVCVGGDRATGYEVAKEQLLRPLDEKEVVESSNRRIIEFERRLLREANTLGIGPMGLGGKTTLLGVKVAARPRVPASFFVTVAYMCWACRRRTLVLSPAVGGRSSAVDKVRQSGDKRQATAVKRNKRG